MPLLEVSAEELQLLQKGCGFHKPNGYSWFRFRGNDALNFLQRLLTNDLINLPHGAMQYQALLDRKGHVRSLFQIIKFSQENLLAFAPQIVAAKTQVILKTMIFSENVAMTDESDQHTLLRFIGPDAERMLQLFSDDEEIILWKEELFETPVWSLVIPSGREEAVTRQLLSKTKRVSKTLFTLLRIKAGIPECGIDIDERHILLEGNLSHTFKRHKGCYPGQEVIERLLAYAQGETPRAIISCSIKGKHDIPNGADILDRNGATRGKVTSSAYDSREDRTYLLASIKRKDAPLFSNLFITNRGIGLTA